MGAFNTKRDLPTMTAKSLMFMGTGSDVGKSLVVAGLCRLLANRGIKVAPFKPQNMSNNAAAVAGGEIGRAQALQARAAKTPATIHLNPVLLKPESERGAQVIVQGKRAATMTARDYFANRSQFLPAILDSFQTLASNYDLILVEGAGSPAETNLRQGDLANMGFAEAANSPVIIIGDIHRGGVIASLVGTHAVLNQQDRSRIKAFLINKFHGDPSLFDEGLKTIIQRTGWQSLGVISSFANAHRLPAEDAVALEDQLTSQAGATKICVLRLPRIANFDDIDPLRLEPGVTVQFLKDGEAIPGDCTLVIIPGSKSTIADRAALRKAGWDIDIAAHARRGGHVLGLCGGYQMLGRMIHDPQGLEGPHTSVAGLGLLDVETTLTPDKTVTPTTAIHTATKEKITAYEIHLGKTTGPDCAKPFAHTERGPDGAVKAKVIGTYLHGCFAADGFRAAFLESLGTKASDLNYEAMIEQTLDELAAHLEKHVDVEALMELAL
jgi:adenosylcobyric acid synthase